MTDHEQPAAGVALKPCDHVMIAITKSSDGSAPYRMCSRCGFREYPAAPTDAGGAVSEASRLRDIIGRIDFDYDPGEPDGSGYRLIGPALDQIESTLAALTPAPQAEGEADA